MVVSVTQMDADVLAPGPVEFVERKGVGHPDTLCDGIAEAVSRRLSRRYRDEFGRILHHNTDAVQLVAGRSAPAFGGGEVVEPFTVLLGGRATAEYDGTRIPVHDVAVAAAREYLDATVPALDGEAVRVESRIGETSPDLRALFEADDVVHANDTSVGVGYAPFSETERIVRSVEPVVRDVGPAVGQDVKVMATGTDDALDLTVAAAVVARHVADVDEYLAVTERVADAVRAHAEARTDRDVTVTVNAADDPAAGTVYLTETGLSAEMGDDGNVGRGNRVNGLIAPQRPTSLEAAAGKNPVSHVGKLYNLVATSIAERIHRELDAEHATVAMVSKIGAPVDRPPVVDVRTTVPRKGVCPIIAEELTAIDDLTDRLVAGEVDLF